MTDRTTTIRASLREVERALAISIGLVILVVFLFLRNARAALVPSVAVPVSLAGTFAFMYLAGYSLDNLSLMALTVATGFVVDDAIVVLENITRHMERGKTAAAGGAGWGAGDRVHRGVDQPVAHRRVHSHPADGRPVGRLFREFAVVLSVAILVSMVVSLTTTPMMCAALLKRPRRTGARPVTRFALDRTRRGGLAARLSALAGVGAAPPATRAARAGRRGGPERLPLWRHCQGFLSAAGHGPHRRLHPGRPVHVVPGDAAAAGPLPGDRCAPTRRSKRDRLHRRLAAQLGADVHVAQAAWRSASVTAFEVVARLRTQLAKEPGANLFLVPVQDIRIGGRQANAAYQFTLQADDLEDLRTWEPRIRQALMRLPELADVNSDLQDRGQQTSLALDREAMARLGLSVRAVDNTLNNAFGQRQVAVIYNPLNQYRVVLELAPEHLQGPESLRNLSFIASDGRRIPLPAVARQEATSTPLAVNHQSGTPAATISFNLPVGVSLSEASDAVRNAMAELGVPVSLRGTFQGTARAFAQSLDSQPLLILAALVAIYLVLGILYESLLTDPWSCCKPASTAGPSTSPSSVPSTCTRAPGEDTSSSPPLGRRLDQGRHPDRPLAPVPVPLVDPTRYRPRQRLLGPGQPRPVRLCRPQP